MSDKSGSKLPRRLAPILLIGTALGGLPALAQDAAPAAAPFANAPAFAAAPAASSTVRAIIVRGTERLEPETVRSYIELNAGDPYDRERLDKALKDLYASELFADVTIRDDAGTLIVEVKENPVVNRIVIEGAKRVKEDKIREEIRVAPRQIFTRSKARADVARILELYRRAGRFAASVEPKIIQLDQNRVDLIFEINEGAKSKVRQINILGNQKFKDGQLRATMATHQARAYRFFASNDTYDPDRLAYDQQKLRQFYLTQGYADFRVVSSTAELTPDRKDFIVTYVVEEGDRYKFGRIELDSQIRDIKDKEFKPLIRINPGDWYNAQKIENTVDTLSETAGLLGYAFAEVRPQFDRDKDKREMNVTFNINEAPRVYVEKININGNTLTRDSVIRREFRLGEGDAFNSFKVKRTRDRIQGLGFFQEKFDIEQKPGSAPDKVILEANVQEKPTGELQVSAGFSSLERFILSLSIRQRNFRGLGQELRASANISSYSKSVELGFTEPYLFGRNLALGVDLFRRDYSSFRYDQGSGTNNRQTTYQQVSTGMQARVGFPITEFWAASFRYGLSQDKISLDSIYNDPITGQCSPLLAGRYLCDSIGDRTTSSVGYSVIYDNLNNRLRPSAGQRFTFSQDFAGVGGGVQYLRSRASYDRYWALFGSGFVLNLGGEAGYIYGYGSDRGQGQDKIRINDRFFLGEPELRGFGIRGVGPRVTRRLLDAMGNVSTDKNSKTDDAIGGRAYYKARAEVQIPLGSAGAELGLRPSVFADMGAVFGVKKPNLICQQPPAGVPQIADPSCVANTVGSTGFREFYEGDSPKPRLSVGAGVSWNSPFGPFRFDIAKALLKQPGDTTKIFQFNVGTQF